MGASLLVPAALRRPLAAVFLLAVVVGACDPEAVTPGEKELGPLRIRPVLESEVDPQLLELDGIQVTITETDGETVVADTLLEYDAGADVTLAWLLALDAFPADLLVHTEVRRGSTAMFAGVSEVEVFPLSAASSETRDVPLPFVGPGHDATGITITPGDSLLSFGDTLHYVARGTTAGGDVIHDPVVVWSSSDPAGAPIDGSGRLRAPEARGGLIVRALTPRGISDSTGVRIQAPPEGLEILAGDGVSVPVASPVPLAVRVMGVDGEGVEGTEVRFEAPEGAWVDEVSVLSDSEGLAEAEGTLGVVAGAYGFTASSAGVETVRLNVTGEAGPPARLVFRVHPSSTEVAEPFSQDVIVELLDEYGNLSDADREVRLDLGANHTGAALTGSVRAPAIGGVAVFAGTSVNRGGSGFTLLASADAVGNAESEPFDVVQQPRAVEVSPAHTTLAALEETAALAAVALDAVGEPIANQPFGWFTSNADVAVVDAEGVVTAVGNGVAEITVTAGEESATVDVVVRQEAAMVLITPVNSLFSSLHDELQLEADARDANGHPIADHPLTWRSSAEDVASVDAEGRVTALGNGSSTVIAEASGGVAGSARVEVLQRAATIRVTPGEQTLDAVGATAQLAAEALDANGYPIEDALFSWTSDNPEIAQVDQEGRVTATGEGETRVSAAFGGASGAAEVGVSPTIATLEVTPDGGGLEALGETLQLAAAPLDANGHPVAGATVSWSSSAPAVATVGATGVVTAVGNGAATVTASADGVEREVAVTVEQTAATIVVEPTSATLAAIDETVALAATVLDANGHPLPDQAVAWDTSDPEVLAVDGALGIARSNGSAFAIARQGAASGSAAISVVQEVTSLTVTPDAGAMHALGETLELVAEALDANGHPVDPGAITWTSDAPSVAAVDAAGVLTAVANGDAVVKAAADGVEASATVTVEQQAATVEVTPPSATLTALDGTVALAAVVLDANGYPLEDGTVTWSSSAPATASVSAAGVVTASADGDAIITAASGGITGSTAITVEQQAATVRVTPTEVSFDATGEQTQLTAETLDANGHAITDATFAWVSDDEEVAQVDAAGLVTATGSGGTLVTATSGGVSASASITVAKTIETLTVTPDGGTLEALEATLQLSAEAFDGNGNPVTDADVTWSSGDPTVAVVSAVGLVTAVANGEATVTAAAGGVETDVLVTVQQQAATVEVTPPSATLTALDETIGLSAVVRDANGHPLENGAVAWSSSAPATASISEAGVVTALADGDATITAASGGITGSAAITVEQQAATVRVTPTAVSFDANGEQAQLTAEALDANRHMIAGATFTWTSDDEEVAQVDQAGLVTATGSGETLVTATAGDAAASAGVEVNLSVAFATIAADPAAPGEVEADGADASMITVRLFDENGAPLRRSGGEVALDATLGTLTAVTDHADGTYTAELWSTDEGMSLVTGTLNHEEIDDSAQVLFTRTGTPSTEVEIDVMPGSTVNPINLGSEGGTPVAVFSTSDFDVRDMDPASVRFAGAAATRWAFEEIDGRESMVFHFPTRELQLVAGGTTAELWGRTVARIPFLGRDEVRVRE